MEENQNGRLAEFEQNNAASGSSRGAMGAMGAKRRGQGGQGIGPVVVVPQIRGLRNNPFGSWSSDVMGLTRLPIRGR